MWQRKQKGGKGGARRGNKDMMAEIKQSLMKGRKHAVLAVSGVGRSSGDKIGVVPNDRRRREQRKSSFN